MPQHFDTQYFQATFLKELSISSTSYQNHQFPKHFHDHYTIQLIQEGVNEGFTESVKYQIGKGGLLVINPGELHAGNSANNNYLKFHTIRLNKCFIKSFCEENELPWTEDVYFNIKPSYDLMPAIKVLSIISSIKHESRLAFDTSLTELLMYLIKGHKKPKPQLAKSLKLAQDFLRAHYQENLTLSQIAEACHLSPYHFLRQFKKQFGIAPFQYLRNIRIEKAKSILSHHSISQTAYQVGFYDHSHFLRHFKKIEGSTPSKQFKNK